jgi:hypothetical protein
MHAPWKTRQGDAQRGCPRVDKATYNTTIVIERRARKPGFEKAKVGDKG